jgi:hypothetical protein
MEKNKEETIESDKTLNFLIWPHWNVVLMPNQRLPLCVDFEQNHYLRALGLLKQLPESQNNINNTNAAVTSTTNTNGSVTVNEKIDGVGIVLQHYGKSSERTPRRRVDPSTLVSSKVGMCPCHVF